MAKSRGYYGREIQLQSLTCDQCGETYQGARRSWTRGQYCRNACRQKAYRDRRAQLGPRDMQGAAE